MTANEYIDEALTLAASISDIVSSENPINR